MVNQGKIEIPEIYQDNLQMVETVEIIIPDTLKNESSGAIERLVENPIEIPFVPLTREEIYER